MLVMTSNDFWNDLILGFIPIFRNIDSIDPTTPNIFIIIIARIIYHLFSNPDTNSKTIYFDLQD